MEEATVSTAAEAAIHVGDVSCRCGFEYRFAAERERPIRFWPKNGHESYRATPLDGPECLGCGYDLRRRNAVRHAVAPQRLFARA